MRDDLCRFLDAPDEVSTLPATERAMLATKVSALVLALATTRSVDPAPAPDVSAAKPGYLTIVQAAELAAVTPEAFRRRNTFRPAIVRLGHRTLRVDERRLRRILASLAEY